MIEYDIFDSNDPENPTIEDEFKMDLTVTLGYGSVTEMLENIDSNEYSFFFEKYKKSCFGPTINNQLISRLMLLVYNSFAEILCFIEQIVKDKRAHFSLFQCNK